jgi:amino acid transporter
MTQSVEDLRSLSNSPGSGPHLRGGMGSFGLYFSVMAYNAPLVVVIGILPVMLHVGNGIGTPIVFILSAILLSAFAAGFIRMAKALPRPGAFYTFITAGLGKNMGLGSGLVTLVTYFSVCAGTFSFAGVVLGSLVHNTFNGPELPWYVWGLVFWLGAAILGYLRIDLSAKVTAVLLALELVVVFIYNVAIAVRGGANGLSAAPFSPDSWFQGSFPIGLLLALSMFGGFEVAVLFRDEVRNPDRAIPRATYGVIATAGIVYTISAWLFINALGVNEAVALATADGVAAMDSTIINFAGNFVYDAATVLVNTSAFAVILCAHNIGARYLFNLSADGVLPRSLSGVHSRHGSPHRASVVVSLAALLLNVFVAFMGVDPIAFYAAMLGIAAFGGTFIFFATSISIPVYMKRLGSRDHGPLTTLILPIIAAVGLGIGLLLAITNFPVLTGGSWGLSVVLLLLMVVIFVTGFTLASVYRRTRPEVYQRIGRQD